jgi:hypothetical protein
MVNLLYDNLEAPNLAGTKGVIKEDTLRIYLRDFSYPYLCTETSDAEKDTTYFYSISPGNFWDFFDTAANSVGTNIPEELIKLLKSTEYRVYFTLFFPYEGFSLDSGGGIVINTLNYLVEVVGIPKEKILFIYGDIRIKTNFNGYFRNCHVPPSNVFGLNIFEHVSNVDTKDKVFYNPNYFINSPKEKRFISLNGVSRSHRMYLIGALKSLNLLDNFYYSWLNHDQSEYSLSYLMTVFKYFASDDKYRNYLKGFLEINQEGPIELDISQYEAKHRENQIVLPTQYYRQSYCSLVTETQIDEHVQNMLFISEKTYKSFHNFHPFIIVGSHGILNYLRNKGYETFSELFDETYDTYEEPAKRINTVLLEIQKFCSKSKKELDNIYQSEYFRDKLIHNWKNFIERKGQEDFDGFIKWLSSYKTSNESN